MLTNLFGNPKMRMAEVHFGLGVAQCSLGVIVFLMDSGCFIGTGRSCGLFAILAGAFGIVASIRQIRGYIITCMVMCILACLDALSTVISVGSWPYLKSGCMVALAIFALFEGICAVVQAAFTCYNGCSQCCCENLEVSINTNSIPQANPLSVRDDDVMFEALPQVPGTQQPTAVMVDGQPQVH